MTRRARDLRLAALECARGVFGDAELAGTTVLRDRPGWFVARLTLVTAGGPRSVIVKTARPRERAALEALTEADVPAVPRLLAVCEDPALVLMQDAGNGPSVADRLLGADRDEAMAAVLRWAAAIGRIQAATLGLGGRFGVRLAELGATGASGEFPPAMRNRFGADRAVAWKVAVSRPGSEEVITDAADGLRHGLAPLGVTVGPEVTAALRAIADRLRVDPAGLRGPGALTPCDGCPDNNVETAGGLLLIDLEAADFRHVAWDAAYLTVPWPTCWCSWRLPGAAASAALDRWRAELEPALAPGVAARLGAAVADATVAWALITVAWFLGAARRNRALGPGGALRPGPRELIQHRLGVAAQADPDGVLGALAGQALAATRTAWGDRPLLPGRVWR
jgi:hypothetical protein